MYAQTIYVYKLFDYFEAPYEFTVTTAYSLTSDAWILNRGFVINTTTGITASSNKLSRICTAGA